METPTPLDDLALVTKARAADLLSVTVRTVERMVESGEAGRSASKVTAFLEMMSALGREIEGRSIDEAIARTLERSGYLAALTKEGTPESEARYDNLKELLTSAEDFHAANAPTQEADRTELDLFLDQVALISDLDGYEHREQRVSLLTAHSAKGLEYPGVFMVGMEEGIFPHVSSARSDDGIEEERRLCYVAMTRAMEKLTICWAAERRRYGERSYQQPSRFLQEIPQEFVEVMESARRPVGDRSSGRSFDEYAQEEPSIDYSFNQEGPDELAIRKGMRVRHPVFGVGSVLALIGNSSDQKLKIQFDRAGVKTVMVKFANLERA